MNDEGTAAEKDVTAPPADDPRKPDSPPDLPARSWKHTARLAFSEFKRDQCTDLAAALTFYSLSAIFPAFVVLAALVGLVGDGENTADDVLGLIEDLGQEDVADRLREPVTQLAQSQAAGFALVLGLAGALWSASAYTGAFGRAMNRIYEVDEGRPFWKLRPLNIAISLFLIVGAAVMLLGATIGGQLAEELADRMNLPDAAVTVWSIAKWPLMLVVMALLVAVLYYATPNVQQPRFRWMSVGAALAIVLWVLGSLGFALYVQSFGSYDRTYGSLAGVIVMLLWLWLTNLALLFGAEFDAELERARELEAGMAAEETLQLPPRDTTKSEKEAAKLTEEIAAGRAIRLKAATADGNGAGGADGEIRFDGEPIDVSGTGSRSR